MMQKRRKIAVFTGNRAEYGMQFPILEAMAADERLEYHLIVGGAHLKEDFGRTLKEIEKDGFRIDSQVQMEMPDDSLFATSWAIGTGILSLSRVLNEVRPEILLVYADRFESFSAMITGTQMGIATAHVEGGDYTEGGALDDSVRHAMSKLAHLHFTTNEQAADRVRSMGEEPWRVFNVGSPALDLVKAGRFATREQVYDRFQLDPAKPVLIFTQHSVATEFDCAGEQVRPSLDALAFAAREWGCQVILTYPNDDAGGRRIMKELEEFVAREPLPGVQLHHSVGRFYYHGILNVAAACLGNSSSGIKETPAFHCPSINIGDRQRGRLRGDNVIDVGYDRNGITEAIRTCLFDEPFKTAMQTCTNPYGAGDAGQQICGVLATIPLDRKLIQKRMTY